MYVCIESVWVQRGRMAVQTVRDINGLFLFCGSLSLYVAVSLSASLSLSLSVSVSVCPAVCLSLCLSIFVFLSLCLCLCLCFSVCASVDLYLCLLCLSVCLSLPLSLSLSLSFPHQQVQVVLFSCSSPLSILSQSCRGADVFSPAEQHGHSAVTTAGATFCRKPYPHSKHTPSLTSIACRPYCIEGKCHILLKPRQLLLLAVCIACKTAFVRGSLASFVLINYY